MNITVEQQTLFAAPRDEIIHRNLQASRYSRTEWRPDRDEDFRRPRLPAEQGPHV